MPIKRKHKYISSVEELKIESFKGDDYTFELDPEVLMSSEISTDDWCDKVMHQYVTEMKYDVYFDESRYNFSMFYVLSKGMKLYFLIDLKTNLVHERQFFVDTINWNYSLPYKPIRKTRVYAIRYDCKNFSWSLKKLHEKKNAPSTIENNIFHYNLTFDQYTGNKLPIKKITVDENHYLVDMLITFNKSSVRLHELLMQYPELRCRHIKFRSLDKVSLVNKEIKELFTLIEMICI